MQSNDAIKGGQASPNELNLDTADCYELVEVWVFAVPFIVHVQMEFVVHVYEVAEHIVGENWSREMLVGCVSRHGGSFLRTEDFLETSE